MRFLTAPINVNFRHFAPWWARFGRAPGVSEPGLSDFQECGHLFVEQTVSLRLTMHKLTVCATREQVKSYERTH